MGILSLVHPGRRILREPFRPLIVGAIFVHLHPDLDTLTSIAAARHLFVSRVQSDFQLSGIRGIKVTVSPEAHHRPLHPYSQVATTCLKLKSPRSTLPKTSPSGSTITTSWLMLRMPSKGLNRSTSSPTLVPPSSGSLPSGGGVSTYFGCSGASFGTRHQPDHS
ncbi:hypothetical protein BC834DRAFT_321168 [Gloeopeniophorella convolvens]|nr:hypothetical protein BC834DRAFT_321168 [Gloeopeniophorella convolvens]